MENILILEKYMNDNQVLDHEAAFEIRFTDINGDDQVIFLEQEENIKVTFEDSDNMYFDDLLHFFDWFPKVFSANLEYVF
uniref:Uncharacterized protein n=1 Tax=Ochrobactrum phage ORM_20 TaxID=2985243 RepID=A0A9N6WTR1_9VIRU|nr:hypothetical protein ORM20_00151 [Ochrobactrum phage ORM_20]